MGSWRLSPLRQFQISDFPLFLWKISQFLFFNKISVFIVLAIDSKFVTFPLFSHNWYLIHFTLFRKNSFPPTFLHFPPILVQFLCFSSFRLYRFPSILTIMHLCIMQYTNWTPLHGLSEYLRSKITGSMDTVTSRLSEPVASKDSENCG